MTKRAVLLLSAFLIPIATASTLAAQVTTKRVVSGISRALWAGAPAGDPRIFVGTKTGRVLVIRDGVVYRSYIDLTTKVSSGSEQGLLGVAFHPNYAVNGYVYVDYTDLSGNTVVSRFTVSSSDPDRADPDSEQVILRQSQPFENHNGGDLHFGSDGYLYVFFGDGGSANDPGCRAQDLGTWLGKILRIDVDSAFPYAVPPDNPFVGVAGALPEIYHYGVRNPWRNGFDRVTGDLYIGDVGQNNREEVSVAPAGSSGLNFGWRMMEANRCNGDGSCTTPPPCNDPGLVDPIVELLHSAGSLSVIGGYVYRGCAVPSEYGKYFFADYFDNKIRSLEYDAVSGTVSNLTDRTAELAPGGGLTIRSIASFGEDGFGELLIVDHNGSGLGEVFKLVPAGAPGAATVVRNGSDLNRVCLASHTPPVLGSEWEVRADTTGHAGATAGVLIGYTAPGAGMFAGFELLVDPSSLRLVRMVRSASGSSAIFRIPIPCDPLLTGFQIYTQAAILGGGLELCNALDGTLGYY